MFENEYKKQTNCYAFYKINMVVCIFVLSFQACLVHTTETIRVRYFMDRLLERKRPVMLVGNAGTGKSVLVGDKLGSLDQEEYMIKNVPFNYYTTSAMLQGRAHGATLVIGTVNSDASQVCFSQQIRKCS